MKLPISALLVVYNEEEVMNRCLSSISDIVDEVIVVHDGPCTDDTLQIAKQYGCQVHIWQKKGNAEHHRSALTALAKNEWVLQIDADEYLSEQARAELSEHIISKYDGVDFYWPIWYNNQYFSYGYKRILYKKSKFYHIACNHEYMKPIDTTVITHRTEALLEHKPKRNHFEPGSLKKRLIPRAKIHAQRLTVPFGAIEKWNCSLKDWEWHQRFRMNHPLLLGVLGTFCLNLAINLSKFIRFRRAFYLRSAYILSIWNASVYWFYFLESRKVRT